MNEFPSIDRVEEMLNHIAERMPQEFYEELNGGIALLPQTEMHGESRPGHPIYIMGRYERDLLGNRIVLYYGSFRAVYPYADEKKLYDALQHTLSHEFRHHMEMRAGVKDLILWDEEQMKRYRGE